MATKSTTADRTSTAAEPAVLTLVVLASWLVPGAGHLWFGRREKGLIFLVTLPLMFFTGIWLEGRIFPFELSDPLVALAAVANLGIGVTWFAARALDLGGGIVTATTYEYGNTFMIVAGLLNFMVMLDAFDIGMGRK
ncbi:MAG TPA: DUF6677 family protein [Vicinamibacterales bacterium]